MELGESSFLFLFYGMCQKLMTPLCICRYGFFDAGSADALAKHRRKRSDATRPSNVGRKLVYNEYA